MRLVLFALGVIAAPAEQDLVDFVAVVVVLAVDRPPVAAHLVVIFLTLSADHWHGGKLVTHVNKKVLACFTDVLAKVIYRLGLFIRPALITRFGWRERAGALLPLPVFAYLKVLQVFRGDAVSAITCPVAS